MIVRLGKTFIETANRKKGHPMSRTREHFVPLLLLLLFSFVPFASRASSQDTHEQFWRFVHAVQDILTGKGGAGSQSIIAKEARLVYGVRFERLQAVVAGNIESCSLVDTSYHQVEIIGKTNPSEDAGFITLKTVQYDTTRVRFHTIVFMKDSTGEYKISIWHAGG
jgi:hypothetical protein